MKIKTSLLAAAAAFAIAPAANAYQGLYGAVGAGLSIFNDGDVGNASSGVGPFTFSSEADYDNGIGVYIALGHAFGNGFRMEAEFGHRNADIDSIAAAGALPAFPSGSLTGDAEVSTAMLNVLYDFGSGGFAPYIGGGVGAGFIDHSVSGSVAGPTSIAFGSDETTFVYQAIAGVAIGLAENLALDLSYRYLGNTEHDVNGTLNGAPAVYSVANNSHNLFAGLRWNFGEAEEKVTYKDCPDGSVVPEYSECPPIVDEVIDRDPIAFTVYFDYDKSNLTPEAANLVREASARALSKDIDTVVVEGNADRSGSSAYNQALSMRRANVVRDALIANGVPAEMIRTEAYGEDNPAKPTPDGVREPLNRRSEVTITFESLTN